MDVYRLESKEFNKKLYGLNVNYLRKRAGFSKVESFSEYVLAALSKREADMQ